MTMKRNILIAVLSLVTTMGLQAQVLVKHGENKERIELGEDKLAKMIFNVYDTESNGDNVLFIRQSGDTLTFDIDQIYRLGFAADFTEVEQTELDGKLAIIYDAANAIVYIINAKEKGIIRLFNVEGRLVKCIEGHILSVAELNAGLYIVSYNNVLNAKIMKK